MSWLLLSVMENKNDSNSKAPDGLQGPTLKQVIQSVMPNGNGKRSVLIKTWLLCE